MAGDIQQTNSEILNTIIKLCETHADYHEIMKKNFHLIEKTTLGNFNFILYISPSDATETIDIGFEIISLGNSLAGQTEPC